MSSKPPAASGLLKGKSGGIEHKWWLVGGVAAGGVAYLYYRSASSGSATTATDPTATDSTAMDPYAGYDSGYGTSFGGAYGSSAGATEDPAIAQAYVESAQAEVDSATALGKIAKAERAAAHPPTNREWMHKAINALEEHGFNPSLARTSIHAYLVGAPLTTKQIHAVESATGYVGPPPQSVPAVKHTPVPKQARKDPRKHTRHKRTTTQTTVN